MLLRRLEGDRTGAGFPCEAREVAVRPGLSPASADMSMSTKENRLQNSASAVSAGGYGGKKMCGGQRCPNDMSLSFSPSLRGTVPSSPWAYCDRKEEG